MARRSNGTLFDHRVPQPARHRIDDPVLQHLTGQVLTKEKGLDVPSLNGRRDAPVSVFGASAWVII
jgi:hypothetical protein